MSWDDTRCPCGDRKERETLLCPACREQFKNTIEMKVFSAIVPRVDNRAERRAAAIRLLAMARRRKREAAR